MMNKQFRFRIAPQLRL